MPTINDSYINALLADATYALTADTPNGLSGAKLIDKLKGRMTPTLAEYIGKTFTVVTHIESSDIFGSGFDATVWSGNNGKYYLSMSEAEAPADPTNVMTGTKNADDLWGPHVPTLYKGLGGSDWIWGGR